MILFIQLFLFITFGYSLFEKISDKKGYTLFLANHLQTKKWAHLFWWTLVLMNSIVTGILVVSIISLFFEFNVNATHYSYYVNSICILVLLIGQRIAKDYQGAANLGIYFLINLVGWYLATK